MHVVHAITLGVAIALLVFAFVQLVRLVRLGAFPTANPVPVKIDEQFAETAFAQAIIIGIALAILSIIFGF